jgi:hypothetical protein
MVSTPVGWKQKTHELLLLEGKLALPAMQGKLPVSGKHLNAKAGKSSAPQERSHYNMSAKTVNSESTDAKKLHTLSKCRFLVFDAVAAGGRGILSVIFRSVFQARCIHRSHPFCPDGNLGDGSYYTAFAFPVPETGASPGDWQIHVCIGTPSAGQCFSHDPSFLLPVSKRSRKCRCGP